MPAPVFAGAFVEGQDQRLITLVAAIEAATFPMTGLYITCIHDVVLWMCRAGLTSGQMTTVLGIINTAYGSTFSANDPYLGPLLDGGTVTLDPP